MRALRANSVGFVAAAAIGVGVFATPAHADWGGWHHRWYHHGWYRPWRPPVVIVAPRPYYYAPPPVVYVPPPAYYAPGVSFGLTVR